jgi:site-specific recombinase XerD
MASINVRLLTWKTLNNDEHPIVIQVIKDRKRKIFSTGYSCSLDLWDEDKQLPKRKHPNAKELELLLEQKKVEAKKLMMDLETEKSHFSINEYETKLRNKGKQTTVLTYFDNHIDHLLKIGKIGNAKVYKDTKRTLSNFRNKKDFEFSDLTVPFLTQYEKYFLELGVQGNTMSVYFRTLRAVFNKAIAEGYAKKQDYPFDDFKISKFKSETAKRALSKEEMGKIIQLDLTENPKLINARNYFVFSYYCMGINFTDMAFLEWKDVETGRLFYKRAKTGKVFNLKLTEPALAIIDQYRTTKTDKYVFPILFEDRHLTPLSMDNRIEKVNKQTNKDLKAITALADIATHVTTYVARHTAASNLKRKGVPVAVISELMGHDDVKTTEIYLANFENDVLDKAMQEL